MNSMYGSYHTLHIRYLIFNIDLHLYTKAIYIYLYIYKLYIIYIYIYII